MPQLLRRLFAWRPWRWQPPRQSVSVQWLTELLRDGKGWR